MAASETERVVERVYANDPRTGARRVVSEEVVSEKTQKLDQDPAFANRGVAKHFADMGVGRGITDLTLQTPPDQLRILTPAELLDTKIATHSADPLRTLGLTPP
jgi:hypothetical protein